MINTHAHDLPEGGQHAADQQEQDPPAPPADDSLKANVERLIASGRELAEAEIAWAKIKASFFARGLLRWLLLIGLALVFLMAGVAVLIASSIIALTPILGLLLASMTVAGLALLLALLFAMLARNTFKNLFDEDDQ